MDYKTLGILTHKNSQLEDLNIKLGNIVLMDMEPTLLHKLNIQVQMQPWDLRLVLKVLKVICALMELGELLVLPLIVHIFHL